MSRAIYHLRRFLAAHFGLLAAVGAATLLGRGFFEGARLNPVSWPQAGVVALLLALLLVRALHRSARPEEATARGSAPAARRLSWLARLRRAMRQLEPGALLLALVAVALQWTGGPASWLQPAFYLALVFLVGLSERPVAALLLLVALALQGAIHLGADELPREIAPFATRAAYLVGFALSSLLLLQVEVARHRREHRRRLAAEIRTMRDEARDFRLISSALSPAERGDRAEEVAKLAGGAVESIHQEMFFVLELLKKSLDLQTCILLWLDASGQRLRIKELVTDSSMVRELPISAQAGALGGVIKNRILLNLSRPRQGARSIPYYQGPEVVGAFLGVPVLEGNHLRGVLCADRRAEKPFSVAEEGVMVEATRQVLRAIQTERVFAAVECSKYEHERFYHASTRLNSALTLAQVYETAFSAAREIAEFDCGALTLYDRSRRKHIICKVEGEQAERLEGAEFGDNAGLVAMVIKNKHFLPAGEELRDRDTVVFTRKLRLRGMDSLVVLPLIVQDHAIGTFVLAARDASRFSKRVREMLGVISNQVAVSIENAKMYKRMEEMATTDGLTGLPNHRTFQARLSEMLHRAERHGKAVSVVLTDIDKFKSVNDTYGHPVGDAVLRRVAGVLAEQVRKVDLVARYGGEEFAMVLEETDSQGALLFCERVRQEVAAQLMTAEQGSFRVTISLGIASYPPDGKEKDLLIERADQALYAAKEGGRNRTVIYSQSARGQRAAGM